MFLVLTRVLGQLSRTSTGANLEGSGPTEMLCQLGLVRRVPIRTNLGQAMLWNKRNSILRRQPPPRLQISKQCWANHRHSNKPEVILIWRYQGDAH